MSLDSVHMARVRFSGGATAMASMRSNLKLCLRLIEPMPAGFKVDPLLAKAKL